MVWHKCVCGYVVAHVVYAFGFAVNKGKCSAQISSRRRLLSLVVVALTASCMSYQWQWYLWWQQQHIHIYYQQSAHWCRWHKGNKTPIKKVHVLGCYFATFLFTAIDSVNVACVFFFHISVSLPSFAVIFRAYNSTQQKRALQVHILWHLRNLHRSHVFSARFCALLAPLSHTLAVTQPPNKRSRSLPRMRNTRGLFSWHFAVAGVECRLATWRLGDLTLGAPTRFCGLWRCLPSCLVPSKIDLSFIFIFSPKISFVNEH